MYIKLTSGTYKQCYKRAKAEGAFKIGVSDKIPFHCKVHELYFENGLLYLIPPSGTMPVMEVWRCKNA